MSQQHSTPTQPSQDSETASSHKYYPRQIFFNFSSYRLFASVVIIVMGLLWMGKIVTRKANNQITKQEISQVASTPTPVTQLSKSANTPKQVSENIFPEASIVAPPAPVKPKNQEFIYNVKTLPLLNKSDKLESIVQSVARYVNSQGLSTNALSVTLIDVNENTVAGYRQYKGRYPASVVKLFWMVALNDKIQKGLIPPHENVKKDLDKMILESNNDASSRSLDRITNTKSGQFKLKGSNLRNWKNKRLSVNNFFRKAEYKNIYVAQKTFPVYHANMNSPVGPDWQIREDHTSNPQRNKISTYQAARLMYEIVDGQAITPKYSQKMLDLLTRKLRSTPKAKLPSYPVGFNPIVGFLGQSLSADQVKTFASKGGWTTYCRLEVAYVESRDGKSRYILAVFGNNSAYAKNGRVFPGISRLVFNRMKN